ncbi:MAG: hypothetical protein O7J95_01630, partial [Planctomycetota bacterium]|nr:hypothetical protein [Planctomycetota bacterium]
GDERQGTRSWLGRGAREIARLRFVGGKPYEGVRFVSDARGTRRRVEVIDHGQVIGFGLFRLAADGSWELVGSQWTYRGE